jgi:hypothetical protein
MLFCCKHKGFCCKSGGTRSITNLTISEEEYEGILCILWHWERSQCILKFLCENSYGLISALMLQTEIILNHCTIIISIQTYYAPNRHSCTIISLLPCDLTCSMEHSDITSLHSQICDVLRQPKTEVQSSTLWQYEQIYAAFFAETFLFAYLYFLSLRN